MRRFLAPSAILLALALLAGLPARAAEISTTLPSTVAVNLWYILAAHESNDPAYNAPFGMAAITGRLNAGILFNGQPAGPAKYATLKFSRTVVVNGNDVVSLCVQKALAVASIQQALDAGNSGGRNAQLVVKITGDITLNEGNGGYEGEPNLTIVEVRALRAIACQATIYMPEIP